MISTRENVKGSGKIYSTLLLTLTLALFILISPPAYGSQSRHISISTMGKVQEQSMIGVNIPTLPDRWKGIDIQSELAKIKEYGFNTIRIPIYWKYLMPTNGVVNEAYFTTQGEYGTAIDSWVDWCSDLGINIILMLTASPTFPPPNWAFPGITDTRAQWDAMMNGTANGEAQSIKYIWQYIADRYRSNGLVVFDLYNEPQRGTLTADHFGIAYKAFCEEIVDGVRAVEHVSHKVIVEWVFYLGEHNPDIERENIIRSFHFYEPWEQAYDRYADFDTVRNSFKRKYDIFKAYGKPILIGEFGRVLNPTPDIGSEDWFKDVFSIFSEFGIRNWCVHNYGNGNPYEHYSIIDSNGLPLDPYFSIIHANIPG